MVNNNAPANNPQECQQQCASLSTCNYWDFGDNYCRLRSNAGNAGVNGLYPYPGYAYGRKNCFFGMTVYTTDYNSI